MTTHKHICDSDRLIQPVPVEASASIESATAPKTATRRSEAMRGFFPQLAVWFSNRIHFSRMREVEKYLAQATDLADLEHRIAKVDRGALWH